MRIFVFLLFALVLVAQPAAAPQPDRLTALEARLDEMVLFYNQLAKAHNDLVDTVTAMLDQGEPAQPRPSTSPIRYEQNFN